MVAERPEVSQIVQPFDPVTGAAVQIGIPVPPDSIFKNRWDTRQNVSQQIFVGNPSFIPFKGEYIEGDGNFVHYAGYAHLPAPKFPSRCVAPADAVFAVNPIKRFFVVVIKFFADFSFRPTKLVNNALVGFIALSDVTMNPFYLKDGYYCPVSREIRVFVREFLIGLGGIVENADKAGEIIGAMFEYDNAYRYRVQDILGEANKEALIKDFPREIERLVSIMASREPRDQSVPERFTAGAKVIRWVWWLPFVRSALRKGINAMNLENCKMDEGEIYHTIWFGDYNVKGKNLEERLAIFKQYHGEDTTLWPPRIVMRQKT